MGSEMCIRDSIEEVDHSSASHCESRMWQQESRKLTGRRKTTAMDGSDDAALRESQTSETGNLGCFVTNFRNPRGRTMGPWTHGRRDTRYGSRKLACFVTNFRDPKITKCAQDTLDPVFNVDSRGELRFEPFPHLGVV